MSRTELFVSGFLTLLGLLIGIVGTNLQVIGAMVATGKFVSDLRVFLPLVVAAAAMAIWTFGLVLIRAHAKSGRIWVWLGAALSCCSPLAYLLS